MVAVDSRGGSSGQGKEGAWEAGQGPHGSGLGLHPAPASCTHPQEGFGLLVWTVSWLWREEVLEGS